MILNCNSCGKRFVVPDSAITASGRLVQCGSCGNKWKQFPFNEIKSTQSVSNNENIISKPRKIQQKTQKLKKVKKNITRKRRELDLYSPEYLEKKHGIKLNESIEIATSKSTTSSKKNVTFGFYNTLLLFFVILIILSRGLYFFQDFVVQTLPFTEFYIDYFFESIRNMFEIWKNLISSY